MAVDYPIRIARVIDGDSVVVILEGGDHVGAEVHVRLYGIDAPERKQQRGEGARSALEYLLTEGRTGWRLYVVDIDRYKRFVGLIYDERLTPEQSVNHEMLEAGAAYWYREYGDDRWRFERSESVARRGGYGVWKDPQAERPWDYRRRLRSGSRNRRAASERTPARSGGGCLTGIAALVVATMLALGVISLIK